MKIENNNKRYIKNNLESFCDFFTYLNSLLIYFNLTELNIPYLFQLIIRKSGFALFYFIALFN